MGSPFLPISGVFCPCYKKTHDLQKRYKTAHLLSVLALQFC